MKIYDNSFKSNYEELKTYYPVWYREVLEMDAIWYALGKQLDETQGKIQTAVNNCFVSTADEETVSRLEDFLYIAANKTEGLYERKRLIMLYLLGFGKISANVIKEMIHQITSAESAVEYFRYDEDGNQAIKITAEKGNTDVMNLAVLNILLPKRMPAHLKYYFYVRSEITAQNNSFAGSALVGRKRYIDTEVSQKAFACKGISASSNIYTGTALSEKSKSFSTTLTRKAFASKGIITKASLYSGAAMIEKTKKLQVITTRKALVSKGIIANINTYSGAAITKKVKLLQIPVTQDAFAG